MKYFLMFLITVSFSTANTTTSKAISHSETVICSLNPHLDYKTCSKYAKLIDKYSYLFGIDWKIPTAIFQQESTFKKGAISHTKDYGLGQIHYKTAQNMGISTDRLLTDEEYAIFSTFRILSEIKTRYDSPDTDWRAWYTRYHSYTPERRQVYYSFLSKRLQNIEKVLYEQRSIAKANKANDSKSSRLETRRQLSQSNGISYGTLQRLRLQGIKTTESN